MLFKKIRCSLFREEVILFWRRGVWTLYWGGLFQCWASFLSSTRWSHATTGTVFLLVCSVCMTAAICPKQTSNGQCFSSIAGKKMYLGIYIREWEELSWVTEKDIGGMQIWLQWLHIHCYMFLSVMVFFCLFVSLFFSALSAVSALWETPVPDWAKAAEWQEAENNLLSSEGDLAVPLPLSNCPSQPRIRVGQPGNDRGCLCGIGRLKFSYCCLNMNYLTL